jgi:hypothetical protein
MLNKNMYIFWEFFINILQKEDNYTNFVSVAFPQLYCPPPSRFSSGLILLKQQQWTQTDRLCKETNHISAYKFGLASAMHHSTRGLPEL